MGRRLLAAIAGGLVVFIWSAVSHTVLPLGTAGISTIPNEERMAQAIRGVIDKPGLYFFPAFEPSRKVTAEQERAFAERYRRGPTGILVVRPEGLDPMEPTQFVIELLGDILAAGVAAFILAGLPGPFLARAASVGLMGVFEWADINVSYWNWYKFPTAYTGAALLEQVVGWTLAGLVMALVLRERRPAARP